MKSRLIDSTDNVFRKDFSREQFGCLGQHCFAMEKARCGRCADITKYLSHEPVSKKSVLSEHVADKEKPKISPWHIRGTCDEVPDRSLSRPAIRLHRLKRNTHRKTSTCLIEDPLKDVVVSELCGSSAGKLEYELALNESSSTLKCSQTERQRDELSLPVQKSLLDEIKASNPLFPVRRVFAMLLKKYTDSLQASKTPEKDISATSLPSPVREKRKHPIEMGDTSTECKRQRCNPGKEETFLTGYCPSLVQQVKECQKSGAQPRRSRLSRTHRLKQQKGQVECLMHPGQTPNTPNQAESPPAYPVQTQICHKRVHYLEDVLWTEKYQPQHSSEIVDNSSSVKKLHSWLKKWKLRADSEERRKEQERKSAENTNSNDTWDCGDFQGETGVAEEGDLCNTMLITGPPGVGKTASVYACSQELGFQVFEVNASSQRSGHHVLTQLREATQSHLVETQESSTLRPSYLSSCNNTSSTKSYPATSKQIPLVKTKLQTSLKVTGAPPRTSRHKRGGGSEACVTLSSFFKMKSKPEIMNLDGPSLTTKHEQQTNSVRSIKTGTMKEVQFSELSPDNKGPPTCKTTKRTATSLILFEEVDVIFNDDAGFLTAIQTFMKTTKRPVILTTSDPYFKLDGDFETALFKTPSVLNVCSYLQLLCLAENVKAGPESVTSLINLNKADIRRSVLQLQLWACSGGGPASAMSCTQSMLGLNTGTIQDLQTTPCHPWAEPDILNLMETLTESWRTGVALLHSNLELLLRLPASTKAQPALSPQGVPHPRPQDETPPPDINPPIPLIQDQTGSVKVSSGSRLRRRNRVQSSDSRSFKTLNINDDQHTAEKAVDKLTSHRLEAIADFMDLMSFTDASLSAPKAGPCRPEELVWTGAEVMDGLQDEMREEDGSTWGWERTLEIQAAVEVLGFQRCLAGVWNGLTRTQGLRGEKQDSTVEKPTLPVAPHRQGFSTCETTPCEPGVVQRRHDLIRTILSSQALCTLGNKQAAVVDYLPVLRAICQSERAREQSPRNGRFLHYLRSIHFSLPKASLRLLAEDFP
ncbi:ATPase family AAA domain-containing protein 5b isoform X2 [Esox lucius]|uniref:ATPase AAA-type core domain-containing protein n=1 Tax=Esox lucius TaxID=8010 RepID=A0A6Q2XBE6_ESOLU|nr:ATPase family AAA domain-containing protein 5b isoform X2 [Esox lucius]